MKDTQTFLVLGITLGVMLLTGVTVMPAIAASRISAEVTTTPTVQLTDEERRALSIAAGRLFVHVGQARQAIAAHDKAGALANVAKGLTLAEIIQRAEPDYAVKSTVKAGNLVYQDESNVKPATVPIFSELDRISLEEPMLISKKQAAKQGMAAGAPVVEDVESTRSQMRLDVKMAQGHLEAAKAALSKGNLKLADASLAAIQDDAVTFEFDARARPLIDARENLMLAKTMLQQGNVKDARAELQAASDALKVYQSLSGEHRAGEVSAMRDEIDKLTPELEKNQADSVGKITALWDRMIKWL